MQQGALNIGTHFPMITCSNVAWMELRQQSHTICIKSCIKHSHNEHITSCRCICGNTIWLHKQCQLSQVTLPMVSGPEVPVMDAQLAAHLRVQ